jgi:hypothetical protein
MQTFKNILWWLFLACLYVLGAVVYVCVLCPFFGLMASIEGFKEVFIDCFRKK